jgi:hypothetical protein
LDRTLLPIALVLVLSGTLPWACGRQGAPIAAVALAASEGESGGGGDSATSTGPDTLRGEARDDSLFGGTVRIHTEDGDYVRTGQSGEIGENEIVTGDAVVIGGNLDVRGKVRGDAVVIGGVLRLHPGSAVRGDAVAVGGRVIKEGDAEVGGQEVSIGTGMEKVLPWGWHHREMGATKCGLHTILGAFFRLLFGFFAILIFVDLFGKRTERVAARVQNDGFRSALAGVLGIVLIPMAILVLIISCVGILLLPVLGVAIGVALAWGIVGASLVAGRTVGQRLFPGVRAPRWDALLGLLILYITNFVGSLLLCFGGPIRFLGWVFVIAGKVILVAALAVGFGAVLTTRFGRTPKGEGPAEEGASPEAPVPASGG